ERDAHMMAARPSADDDAAMRGTMYPRMPDAHAAGFLHGLPWRARTVTRSVPAVPAAPAIVTAPAVMAAVADMNADSGASIARMESQTVRRGGGRHGGQRSQPDHRRQGGVANEFQHGSIS